MLTERRPFGQLPCGSMAELCTLRSACAEVTISTLGATIVSVRLPDRNGKWDDVVLGFDSPQEYLENSGCLGATIGRYAGRISGGCFPLNGRVVQLEKNRGQHTIHGGPVGFHKRLWHVGVLEPDRLELELFSPYGDQGFPGAVTLRAIFTLEGDTLTLKTVAVSDDDTPCSLTNHVYWNLAGHGSGTVDAHILWVPAEAYLETDAENIPTGRILPLEGTDLDLREPVPMKDVHADHSFLLENGGELHPVGRVYEPSSGRCLEVFSDLPSVQVYTADHMRQMPGKGGTTYGSRRGMCLEAQFYPDSPNHAHFPDTILHPGEEAVHRICWRFGVLPREC